MKYDFRKNDVVSLKLPLAPADKQKLIKFASKISDDQMDYYIETYFLKKGANFKVRESKVTAKTKTQYSFLTDNSGVSVAVQARYINLVNRKAKHPLTKIFQD